MESNPALRAVELDESPGAAYESGTRNWQGIPGIERTTDGTLWATWYSGGEGEGPDNYVLLVQSDDDGATWSTPQLVVDPPGQVRAFDPCLWGDPLERLWLFWAQENGCWDGRGGVWATINPKPTDGSDWSSPRRLCDGIMLNKPTVLTSGEWCFPATRWDLRPQLHEHDAVSCSPDEFEHWTTPVETGSVPTSVYRSRDYGQSVERVGGTQVPPTQWSPNEPMLVERRDGRLWMLIRTAYGIGESFSTDGGTTWTPVRDSGLEHPPSRFFIRRLESGRLLLVKHDNPSKRTALTAYLSEDDGASWTGGLVLDDREGVSYPDGVEGTEGRLYVIYDRDRYGAEEILMARFREADVAAGAGVTEGFETKTLVDRGGG